MGITGGVPAELAQAQGWGEHGCLEIALVRPGTCQQKAFGPPLARWLLGSGICFQKPGGREAPALAATVPAHSLLVVWRRCSRNPRPLCAAT